MMGEPLKTSWNVNKRPVEEDAVCRTRQVYLEASASWANQNLRWAWEGGFLSNYTDFGPIGSAEGGAEFGGGVP